MQAAQDDVKANESSVVAVPGAAPTAPASPAPWWELCIRLPAALGDDAAALLVDAGAMGVETMVPSAFAARAWQRHASMGPRSAQPPAAIAASHLSPHEAENFLLASFEGQWTEAEVTDAANEALGSLVARSDRPAFRLSRRNDVAWAYAWREHYKPLKVGRSLWVVPSWEHRFAPPAGSIVVSIDPGMAFGTGQHATTVLCLKAIERRLGVACREGRALSVLDVGAGTGILAVAALKLGCKSAVLCDIDPLAVAACRQNLAAADLTARAQVTDTLMAPQGHFDLVVANILANALVEMSAALVGHVAAGGTLLLSGILAEQADEVSAAVARAAKAAKRKLPMVATLKHGEWVALAYGASLDVAGA